MNARATAAKICFVEDDVGIREAIDELLTSEGFVVGAYRDGAAALSAIDAGYVPDVILLDLMMPNLSGWDFRVEQRKRRSVASVPVIVMSANGSSAARAIDAFAYFSKPLSFEALRTTIGRAIDDTARRRASVFDREVERQRTIAGLVEGIVRESEAPMTELGANLETAARLAASLPESPESAPLRRVIDALRVPFEKLRHTRLSIAHLTTSPADDWGPIDLRSLLGGTASLAQGFFRNRATLVTEFGELPTVIGNEASLGFAILGVLVNAAQASEQTGESDRRVDFVATREGSEVVLEIRDQGVGMEDDVRRRVFDPFFTTRPPGEGSGLGLSIALETVRAHGGEIAVTTERGRGSTFRITLPIQASPRL